MALAVYYAAELANQRSRVVGRGDVAPTTM